jgi:hypothetical protein
MEARTSAAVTGLPTTLLRDRKCQYRRKPFRCQRTTVSGFTIRRGFDHFDQQSAQHDPEQAVGTAQARPLGSAFQYNQLLPQGDDFKPQVMTRPNKTSQPREQTQDQPMHESVLITRLTGVLVVDPPDCVLGTYKGALYPTTSSTCRLTILLDSKSTLNSLPAGSNVLVALSMRKSNPPKICLCQECADCRRTAKQASLQATHRGTFVFSSRTA